MRTGATGYPFAALRRRAALVPLHSDSAEVLAPRNHEARSGNGTHPPGDNPTAIDLCSASSIHFHASM